MNESLLRKARNLADGFAAADTDDVTLVLGEALLEALAELLVPEDERESFEHIEACRCDYCLDLADAKRQHPAYQAAEETTFSRWGRAVTKAFAADMRPMRPVSEVVDEQVATIKAVEHPHPEFLEGEAAYEAAPEGTRVALNSERGEIEKSGGVWHDEAIDVDVHLKPVSRRVVRWGFAD